MLPKSNRLTRKDFEILFRAGKKASNKDFFARFYFLKDIKKTGCGFKVAVVTSSKISKKAVVRNRIRRRVYASFRRLLPSLPSIWSNVFLSLSLTHDISKMKTAEIDTSLKNLLSGVKF